MLRYSEYYFSKYLTALLAEKVFEFHEKAYTTE